MKSTQKEIPPEIYQIMEYLSNTFAKSMNDPIQDSRDLFNDLVVLYLEHLESGVVTDPEDKNQWFIFFKSRLLNKYKKLRRERKGLERLMKLKMGD